VSCQERKEFGVLDEGEGSDGEPRPLSERIGGCTYCCSLLVLILILTF